MYAKKIGRPKGASEVRGFNNVLAAKRENGLSFDEFKVKRDQQDFIKEFEKESRPYNWAKTSKHHDDHQRQTHIYLSQVTEEAFNNAKSKEPMMKPGWKPEK
jgi:hypothetical protein